MITWPRVCPICPGDLHREDGTYGPVWSCAACGHREVAPMVRIPRQGRRLIRVPGAFLHLRRAA